MECGALLIECRALLMEFRALLMEFRALLMEFRALLIERSCVQQHIEDTTAKSKDDASATHCYAMQRTTTRCYGVATISRLLKIIGLFCRIWPLL